ncbi:MAG: DUF1574 domain-containing protein [Clostridia bacterium]|jgi:hypothetical protein|nr:DUF1574 domain-containing protein [Clostridia bacterium]
MRENLYTSSSKKTKRNGIICFLIIVCVLAISAPIFFHFGKLYREAAAKNTINAFTKQRFDDFYALDKDSLDMVFVGSSHCYCTFDPDVIEKYTSLSSFQMGTPLQHPDTTYFELKEIFKTQRPKYVVMEVYWDVLDDDFELKQADSFFQVLNDDELKKEYIKEVFPLSDKVKYSLSPIRFQQDYFAYAANEMQKELESKYGVTKKTGQAQEGEEHYAERGYVLSTQKMLDSEYNETNQFRNFDGKDWEMAKPQKKYLEKIISLCNDEGSKLIFVTAPIANVSIDYIKNYENINKTVSDFAKKYNIPYLDFNIVNKQEKLFTNDNFRDDAHLNHSGVEIADKYFSKWFENNCIN